MGDWTEHLCPCPSKLRWALPAGARRQLARGGRTDRWPQRIAIPSRTILLPIEIQLYVDSIPAYAQPHTASTILLVARVLELPPDPGPQFQAGSSAPSCAADPAPALPGGRGPRYTGGAWAEDKATRGRDPSADPGAKTGAGGTMPPLGIPGLAPMRSIHRQSSDSHYLTTLPERSARATSPPSREPVHPPLHAGSPLETVRSAD